MGDWQTETGELEKRIGRIVLEIRTSIGVPSAKTISNLLRAAREHDPEASPVDVTAFVAWKLQTGRGRFRSWGAIYCALREDYPGWKLQSHPDESRTVAVDVSPAGEGATVLELQQHLTALWKALRETSAWDAPSEGTSYNILRAARDEDPYKTPKDIASYVREIVTGRSFRGWGAVVNAIRERWLGEAFHRNGIASAEDGRWNGERLAPGTLADSRSDGATSMRASDPGAPVPATPAYVVEETRGTQWWELRGAEGKNGNRPAAEILHDLFGYRRSGE